MGGGGEEGRGVFFSWGWAGGGGFIFKRGVPHGGGKIIGLSRQFFKSAKDFANFWFASIC